MESEPTHSEENFLAAPSNLDEFKRQFFCSVKPTNGLRDRFWLRILSFIEPPL